MMDQPQSPASQMQLPLLAGAIGEKAFVGALLEFLEELCGAEHCALFKSMPAQPCEIDVASHQCGVESEAWARRYFTEQYWGREPLFQAATAQDLDDSVNDALVVIELEKPAIPAQPYTFASKIFRFEGAGNRVVLTSSIGNLRVSLSLLKTSPDAIFSATDLQAITAACSDLLTISYKHFSLIRMESGYSFMLTKLNFIEHTITTSDLSIPKREAEVCARIVYGMSTCGIALELGVSEETVMTYRRRLYERLAIGSQRELLIWYFEQVRTHGPKSDTVPTYLFDHDETGLDRFGGGRAH